MKSSFLDSNEKPVVSVCAMWLEKQPDKSTLWLRRAGEWSFYTERTTCSFAQYKAVMHCYKLQIWKPLNLSSPLQHSCGTEIKHMQRENVICMCHPYRRRTACASQQTSPNTCMSRSCSDSKFLSGLGHIHQDHISKGLHSINPG